MFQHELELPIALGLIQVDKLATAVLTGTVEDSPGGASTVPTVRNEASVGQVLEAFQNGFSEMTHGEGIGNTGNVDVMVEYETLLP